MVLICQMCSRVSCWPMGPLVRCKTLVCILGILGIIFSIVMLINCLKRKPEDFLHPLTKEGEYDKLIWAAVIIASLWFYFVGTIVYYFVVTRAKKESEQ